MNKFKNKILVVTHVNPYLKIAGQNLRVSNMLQSLNKYFEVHLVILSHPNIVEAPNQWCQKQFIFKRKYNKKKFILYLFYFIKSIFFSITKSLKRSNYIYGELEFNSNRFDFLLDKKYDFIMFEYWHGYKIAQLFKKRGVKTICDTHNILWKTLEEKIKKNFFPVWFKTYFINKYRFFEENIALESFDDLIGINKEEFKLLKKKYNKKNIYLCGMGIDASRWKYRWKLPKKNRIFYYGSLNVKYNQEASLFVFNKIFLKLKKIIPDLEFWIIGNNPPEKIKKLSTDSSIKVTGFVKNPNELFEQCSMAVIPWSGKYGFRGRIIEIMSVGTPVITTVDALDGMSFTENKNVTFCDLNNPEDWMRKINFLFKNPSKMLEISMNAKQFINENYTISTTYDKLSKKLLKNIK